MRRLEEWNVMRIPAYNEKEGRDKGQFQIAVQK